MNEKQTLREQVQNANARIEHAIWLDGIDWDSPSDVFKEMAEDGFDAADASVDWLKNPPEWVDIDDEDTLFDWLSEQQPTGYLVKASRPVPTMLTPETEEFSWGHYNSRVFYAESVEATVPLIVAWANGIRQRAIDKLKGDTP